MRSSKSLAAALLANATAFAQEVPVVDLATGASCACTKLTSQYGNVVLDSSSASYVNETTLAYWDIRSDLSPKCIFLPKTADDVSQAMSTISGCGAQFAIRGGGHMNYPGSNNIEGGVLIGLNGMDDITIASDNATFETGPGTRWVDVYTALAPYGLYAIGGRLKTIGVPGLTLIGGFHYLINKYGMTMDNVVSYDVVLGNGTQVVANDTQNSELFWSLKGGANNFGIVTKFKFKALPIPKISTTIQNFNESDALAFIEATANIAKHHNPELAAGSVISMSYNATTDSVTSSLLGVQEGTESPPSTFANFTAIPGTSKIDNVLAPIDWHSNLVTPNQMFRIQFAHHTIKPDSAQLYAIFQAWRTAVADIKDVEGILPTFVLNVLPASAMSVAKNNGVGNVWGLDDDQPWILWQLATSWDNAADDTKVTKWAENFVETWHAKNKELGLSHEFLYMGDAGEFQDPFTTFPAENVQRLKAARECYDPEGVFTTLNTGGFKLGA